MIAERLEFQTFNKQSGHLSEVTLWGFPEGVTDLFFSKLTVQLKVWVVSSNVGGCDWGIGLYGIVEYLPAVVVVASGISKAKLVLFVHAMHSVFKFVVQTGEVLD
eukprot:829583-Pelagomonas_calceolata.AAC.1